MRGLGRRHERSLFWRPHLPIADEAETMNQGLNLLRVPLEVRASSGSDVEDLTSDAICTFDSGDVNGYRIVQSPRDIQLMYKLVAR